MQFRHVGSSQGFLGGLITSTKPTMDVPGTIANFSSTGVHAMGDSLSEHRVTLSAICIVRGDVHLTPILRGKGGNPKVDSRYDMLVRVIVTWGGDQIV